MSDLVLGIDGGGSKTTAWLARSDAAGRWQVLGRGRSGPGNPLLAAFDEALVHVTEAVDRAFVASGIAQRPVAAACLALAGVGRPAICQAVLEWAVRSDLAANVRIVHDAEAVLSAGTPEGWGIALISGTGSFAFGRDSAGRDTRAGGWGHLLGDEGSGYAIGVAALRAVMRAEDGRGAPTSLTDAVLKRWGLKRAAELVSVLSTPDSPRERVAGLAPLVFESAQTGDDVASRILAQAADELAALVSAVASRLGLAEAQFTLAMAGGVLAGREVLRDAVVERLRRVDQAPSRVHNVPEPVAGAVLLAVESLG